MTKRRLYALVGGVVLLFGLSFLRLRGDGPAEYPPQSTEQELPARPPRNSKRGGATEARVAAFSGKTMGTTYSVKFVPPGEEMTQMAQVVVEGALLDVNESMSTYDPKSEISTINRSPLTTPLPVSAGFAEVMRVAVDVHALTDGAFDVTVGPLVRVYGFGPDDERELPPAEELTTLEESVGLHHVRFDDKGRTVQKLREGVELDFSGVAKGYGVDRAALALEKLGVESYMVEVGGEIRVRGEKAPRTAWVLAIEEPIPGQRRIHATLELPKSGGALATSGNYRNFRNVGGKLVSHTFDPKSKKPVPRRTASASVVRPTATEADALATAMNVLEPERAMSIANEKGLAVYLLVHRDGGGFERMASREFENLAVAKRSPVEQSEVTSH